MVLRHDAVVEAQYDPGKMIEHYAEYADGTVRNEDY